MGSKGVRYRKEFFDRSYTMRETYARAGRYAWKYRSRILIGLFCGLLTAGTLLPIFSVASPLLSHLGDSGVRSPAALPSWYPKAKALADGIGLPVAHADGTMGGAFVLTAVLVLSLLALVRLVLVYFNRYFLTWAAARTVMDLRQDLLRKIQEQSLQFHGRIDVGQLMSRAINDPQVMQTLVQTMLADLCRAPFEILVSVAFLVWFAIANDLPPTLGVLAVGVPALMLPVCRFGRIIRKWSRHALEKTSVVGARLHEVLTCIRVVAAYDTAEYENGRYSAVNRSFFDTNMCAVRWGLLVGPAVETIGLVLVCVFLAYCFVAHVTLTDVLAMLMPLLLIYKPVKQLANLQISLAAAQASLQRIWSLMDVDLRLPEREDPVRKASFDDRIVFEDVTFRYETSGRDAVSRVSFEIPRGKVIAVVGGTGSGKTTLSGLLARFFDPRTGRVTMDGVDLRDLRLADLRRLVGSVQQETILFNDTIEENIRYGSPDATHEEVVAAAKMANAHDFILAQPEGYARLAGEKGFALSGGERQRIAIARAILRNPPILILDEATSALDTVTEKLVQDALDNLMQNRTVFAIAHRLSTIRDADLILVMDHGEIVERGTHDALYAANGVYRRLCDMQHQN